MLIELLVVPDCPNHPIAVTRVQSALVVAGILDAVVRTSVVVELAQAETVGMHGSPTILIDGRDPFAVAGTAASISCRLYQSTAGTSGCPTVDEFVEAINASLS